MENENTVKTKRQLVLFFGALAFVVLYGLSWLKWGDLYVDTFRDQYIISRVLQGSVLYMDVAYLYGFLPITFLIKANLFFGNSLFVTIFACSCSAVCSTIFFYRICRFAFGRSISFFSTLLFISAFIFNSANTLLSYILPYSSASIFFIMFILMMLWSSGNILKKQKNIYTYISVATLSLAGFCRLDMWVLVICAMFFFGAFYFHKTKNAIFIKNVFKTVTIVCLGYLCFLLATGALRDFVGDFLNNISLQQSGSGKHYEQNILGLSAAGFYLKYSFLFFGIQVFMSFLCGFCAKKIRSAKTVVQKSLIVLLFFACLGFVGLYFWTRIRSYFLGIICILVCSGVCWVYKIAQKKKMVILDYFSFLIFLVSSFLWIRIGLRPVLTSYFFYLGVPSLFLFFIFLIKKIPEKMFAKELLQTKQYKGFVCIYLLLLSVLFAFMNYSFYSPKQVEIVSKRGSVKSYKTVRTAVFSDIVNYLNSKTPKDASVLVLPEGYGMYFFSDRVNNLKDHCFLPLLVSAKGQENIINEIKENNVDYIVLVYGRDSSGYGASFWGVEYAQKIDLWIHDNYVSKTYFGLDKNDKSEVGAEIFQKIKN